MSGLNTGGLEELAGLVHFRVGAWQGFGYEKPSAPDSATIPPLGERSANAIKAGHDAVRDIDQLIARLHGVRAQLVSELRRDEDIRMARTASAAGGPAGGHLDPGSWTRETLLKHLNGDHYGNWGLTGFPKHRMLAEHQRQHSTSRGFSDPSS